MNVEPRFVDRSTWERVDPRRDPGTIAAVIKHHPDPGDALLAYMDRCVEDLDLVCAVTGPEGSTKSTVAEHLARILDPGFDPANVCQGVRYWLQRFRDVAPGSAVILDEAGEGMHNRDAMGKENKIVNEVLMQARVRHLYLFLCFPRFESMDLYPRTFRTRVWIRCLGPGRAEVRLRDWDVPMGPEREDALNAFVPACKITYPRIGEDGYWDEREGKKEGRLKEKITTFLTSTA